MDRSAATCPQGGRGGGHQTYVYWNCRFIRFCFHMLGQSPHVAGPPAITAYLDFLALERNVAPATQKQALNAMAFLMKNVLGIEEFTLDHITPARGQRRPPVVMTREEVRSVFAHLEDPWKLAAQIMYGKHPALNQSRISCLAVPPWPSKKSGMNGIPREVSFRVVFAGDTQHVAFAEQIQHVVQ